MSPACIHCNTLRRQKNEKWWKMPFWPINVQSLFLLSLLVYFWIRTQAFSVFSEVSCCVAASQQESETATVWIKETDCSFFVTFLFLVIPSTFKTGRVPLFYLITIDCFSPVRCCLSSGFLSPREGLKRCIEVYFLRRPTAALTSE